MLYSGVFGFKFTEMIEDNVGYGNAGRHILTLSSKDAMGISKDGAVVVIYNVVDDLPMVITERIPASSMNILDVEKRVSKFNETHKDFIAYVVNDSNIDGTIDVIIIKNHIYELLQNEVI